MVAGIITCDPGASTALTVTGCANNGKLFSTNKTGAEIVAFTNNKMDLIDTNSNIHIYDNTGASKPTYSWLVRQNTLKNPGSGYYEHSEDEVNPVV